MFDGFFCHILDYNTYTEIATDMFEKKLDFFKSHGIELLENLAEKNGVSVYGGKIRRDWIE